MTDLKLFTFGPPRLERNAQPFDLNLRKAMAILVYLAVTAQPQTRDALATLLWPDSDQREGRGRLRRTLHRLRDELGDTILDVAGDTVRLGPAARVWLDRREFELALAAGRREPGAEDGELERLAHAVALYTDDFLAGWTLPDSPAFDEWQFFERERLQQSYAHALARLTELHETAGRYAAAIGYARRRLSLDPLDEAVHRQLMRLYSWAGQPAAAIRQYNACVRLLNAELAAEPDDETQALVRAIKAKQLPAPSQPAPSPVGAPLASAPVQAPDHAAGAQAPVLTVTPIIAAELPDTAPVFVARRAELAQLDAWLGAALSGQRRVVFVVGEAGLGKTALLQAFARQAQQAHPRLVVAAGNCNAYTGIGDPYLPFREILELLTGDVEARTAAGTLPYGQASRLWHTLTATTQALLELGRDLLDTFIATRPLLDRVTTAAPAGAPWLQQLEVLASRETAHDERRLQQQELFEQYVRVIEDVSRRVPLLLVLDDLQWVDRGSADLLFHLGRRLVGSRVLIVAAYRPTEVGLGRDGERHPLERVVNEFQREFGDIVVDLGHAEGQALVEGLVDSEPNQLDQAFRDTLYRQTGGHPLFTLELLRAMQERGDLVQDEAGRWIAERQLDWGTVPARIEGAISERFNRLAPALQELLQVASAEGEEFTAELVARVLGLDEREVIRRLSRDLDKTHRLVRAVEIRREGGIRLSRYRFAHILIQQYVYTRLDAAEQVYLNEELGHELERMFGDRAEHVAVQLARHFAAAQLAPKAAIYLEHAGDQARRSAALAEAAHRYAAALDHVPEAERARHAVLRQKLGEALWLSGQVQDALAHFEASAALFEVLGDQHGAGAVQRRMGRVQWEMGDRGRSLQYYERALALLEHGPETVELGWAISGISQMHMLASDNDGAIRWGQRALDLAERLGAAEVAVHALANVGAAYFGLGNIAQGEAMLRRSWRQAIALELHHDACRAAHNLGTGLAFVGEHAAARAVSEELHSYAVRMQVHLFVGGALIQLVRLDWLTGQWRSALQRRTELREWLRRGQAIGFLEVISEITFAWMHNDLGQVAAASQQLDLVEAQVVARGELQTTGPYLGQRLRTFGMLAAAPAATMAARDFLAQVEPSPGYADTFMSHLEVCRWLSDSNGSVDAELQMCLAQVARAHARFGGLATAAALDTAAGSVALRAGDVPTAVSALQQAVAHWQALGYPYWEARTLAALGRALLLNGAAAAGAAFEQGQAILGQLAAQLDAPELRASLLDSALARGLRAGAGATAMARASGDEYHPESAPYGAR